MQKIFKGVLSLCLAFAVCIGVTAVTDTAVAEGTTDYYSAITATSGTKLLGQLHDLITASRTKYSSYADSKNYGTTTDPGSKSNTVMEFYTHIDIENSKWDVSGGWNREHVWPKSDSNGLWKDKTVGGGADLHHIRPSEKDLNAKRGNLKYGEVKNGNPQYTSVSNILGGYSTGSNNSGTFEPLDNVKGDVARILMYLYTHYNNYTNTVFGGNATTNGENVTGYQSSYFGTLNYMHIMTATSESAAIELLLKWNEADPVDSIETTRNDVVYGIQGNRNPFIDHPEYAEAIWGSKSAQPDSKNIERFKNAVGDIVTEGALNVRLDTINYAITKYNALSDVEKTEVASEMKTLQSAIDEYNKTVKAYNEEAEIAESAALKSAGGLLKR